jgi:hypothetical protein
MGPQFSGCNFIGTLYSTTQLSAKVSFKFIEDHLLATRGYLPDNGIA